MEEHQHPLVEHRRNAGPMMLNEDDDDDDVKIENNSTVLNRLVDACSCVCSITKWRKLIELRRKSLMFYSNN